jgi:hypothetical protein
MKHRSTVYLFLSGSCLFIFYFVVKCFHFNRCDYTSDMFSHFQISRDWLIGKPLFYENCFGLHSKLHNYFLNILLAPFTYLFSAYGLFIAVYGLMIFVLFRILRWMDDQALSFQTKLLFLVFYAGPLTYFILHDEIYGFHIELLLIPLCLMFTISFMNKNKWYIVWAILVLFVKEEVGVVLWSCACLVHLSQWSQKETGTRSFIRNLLLVSLVCSLLFAAGILWLKYQNDWGNTRSGALYRTFREQSFTDVYTSFRYLIGQRVQLTVFILLPIFLYAGRRYSLGVILLSIPVLAFNLLAGVIYFQDGVFMEKNFFSVLWAPRLSMYWAFWLSALLLALRHKPRLIIYPKFARTLACLMFAYLVFKFQVYFFRQSYITNLDIPKNITTAFEKSIELEFHPEYTDAILIAGQLPKNYPVAPIYKIFGAFHKQDIVWRHNFSNAYFPARMFLTSTKFDETIDVRRILKQPVFMTYKDRLNIYAEAEDTIYVSKAGIVGKWERVIKE